MLKSPIQEQLGDSGVSTAGSALFGGRFGQSKLENALHRVSNTWLASESESGGGGDDDGWLTALEEGDDVNNWQGSRPAAPAWESLSDQLDEKAAAAAAAAKDEQLRYRRELHLQQAEEQAAAAAEEEEAKARTTAEGAAWIAGVVHQRRPTSAPPPSSRSAARRHPKRPSSASVRQEDSAAQSQYESGLTVSALEPRRGQRRRKPPLPAFKARPTRLGSRCFAPQRLLPGRAELLGGGWSRIEPFEATHPCYFWHGRWKRGTWAHPMEPESIDEDGLAEQLTQAGAYGQVQEVLRLERVAQLAGFRAGGGLGSQ